MRNFDFKTSLKTFGVNLILPVFFTAIFLTGCSSTKTIYVDVPPKFDLKRWKTIGVIEFATESKINLAKKTTQRFIQTIQEAQPGVIIVELGDKAKVLESVGKTELDMDALKAVKEAKGTDAVFFADILVTEPKTKVKMKSLSLTSITAKKKVSGELTGKLWDTGSGGVAWTNSARGEWELSSASLTSVTVADSDEKYNEMVNSLVANLTPMFRPTKQAKKVPK